MDGLDGLARMKPLAGQMATASEKFSLNIIYQFDGNRLLPVRPCK
jgi:hypothetical protein